MGSAQFDPCDFRLCVACAWSNSQRTVSPTLIVLLAGLQAWAGESTASMTTVSAARTGEADIAHAMAATTASSTYRVLRINGSPPLNSTLLSYGLISNPRR